MKENTKKIIRDKTKEEQVKEVRTKIVYQKLPLDNEVYRWVHNKHKLVSHKVQKRRGNNRKSEYAMVYAGEDKQVKW